MTTHYKRGAEFERWVVNHLEAAGYLARRTPGSKSAFDVIMVSQCGSIWFISCKSSTVNRKPWPPPAERQALIELAERFNAKPVIACKGPGSTTPEWWGYCTDPESWTRMDRFPVTRYQGQADA